MNLEYSSIYFSTDLNDTVFGEPPAVLGDVVPAIWLAEGELPFINFNVDMDGSTSAIANDAVDQPPSPAPQTPVVPSEEVDVLTLAASEPTIALSPLHAPESSSAPSPLPALDVVSMSNNGPTPFFSPSSSSLALALGIPPPTNLPTPIGLQSQLLALPQPTGFPLPTYTAGQHNGGYPQTNSNNTTPEYLFPSPVGSLMSLSSTPVVPTPPMVFAAAPVHVAGTNHAFPDHPYSFNHFPLPHQQVENANGIGYNQGYMVQQHTIPAVPMPPPQTTIYTPPTQPAGVVRRKRKERTSALVNTSSPYPAVVSRQASGSNAALSCYTKRYSWMNEPQSTQSGDFIPDYGSPGDPASQTNTSGGYTEMANAKAIHKIKDSQAEQRRLEKLENDTIRRNAISDKIKQLGKIVPQRLRDPDHKTTQTDILGDVLHFFCIEVPDYIMPPIDNEVDKKLKGKAEKAADRAKIEVARREFTKRCVGALATRLLGTVIPVKDAQKLVVLDKTLKLVEKRINGAAPSH